MADDLVHEIQRFYPQIRALLDQLQPRQRTAAVRGLGLLAAAARKMRR